MVRVKMNILVMSLLIVLVSAGFSPAQSLEEADRVLGALVLRHGVSKNEDAVRKWIVAHLKDWIERKQWEQVAELKVDERGNVRLKLGRGPVRGVFVAHMDEIGFEVEKLNDDGSLILKALGGYYSQLWPGRVIYLQKDGVVLPALIVEALENRRFRAWTGLDSKEAVLNAGYDVEMIGTIIKEYLKLAGPRRIGRGMDDRVGCTAQILAVHHLDPKEFTGSILFVWSVEEEIGLNGAEYVAGEVKTPVVFAVDTFVSGDSPIESDHFAQGYLGQGAVIRAGDHSNIVPDRWVKSIKELARIHGIPIQYGVTGGGNDGSVFVPYGSVDVPLAWSLRYSHSPVDYTDLRDVVALARLVKVIAEDLAVGS